MPFDEISEPPSSGVAPQAVGPVREKIRTKFRMCSSEQMWIFRFSQSRRKREGPAAESLRTRWVENM